MDNNGEYPGSRVKRLRVDDTATIGGDTVIGGDLTVQGTIQLSTVTVDKILTDDGTVSLPSHSFSSAPSTGMYRDSVTSDLSFTRAGQKRLRIGNTTTESITTVIAPTYSFTGGTSTFINYNPSLPTVDVLVEGKIAGTFLTGNQFQTNNLFATKGNIPEITAPYITGNNLITFYPVPLGSPMVQIKPTGTDLTGDVKVTGSVQTPSLIATTGTCSILTSTTITTNTLNVTNLNWGTPAYWRGTIGDSKILFSPIQYYDLFIDPATSAENISLSGGNVKVGVPGWYVISAQTNVNSVIGPSRTITIFSDGVALASQSAARPTGVTQQTIQCSTLSYLEESAIVGVQVLVDSSSSTVQFINGVFNMLKVQS